MEIILLLLYIFFCGHFWKIIFFYQNVYFNNCRWPGREKQLLGKWIFYIMFYGAPFPLVLEAHCGQMALLSPASPLVLHRMFHQEYFLPFTLCSSPSRSIDGFWALPRPSSFSSAFCLVFLMWSLFALGSYKYFRLFLYIFDLKNRVRISALHFSWYLSMVCRMKRVNAELGKHLLIRHLVFVILPKHFVVLNLFRVTFKLENNWNFVF